MPAQLYDRDTLEQESKLSPMPLSALALEYRKNDTNFLTFEHKPSLPTMENAMAKRERFDVANKFGAMGKGEFDFLYGLNAPQAVTYELPSLRKKIESQTGAIIIKEGEAKCTPGYEMKNGKCEVVQTDIICQPGWNKQGGICVKGSTEFMTVSNVADSTRTGDEVRAGGYNTAEKRKYLQEMATASTVSPSTTPLIQHMALGLFAFVVVVAIPMYMFGGKSSSSAVVAPIMKKKKRSSRK